LSRKSKKALQEAREDLTIAERKYHESKSKVEELELEITRLGSTNDALQQDLKLAFKRISGSIHSLIFFKFKFNKF